MNYFAYGPNMFTFGLEKKIGGVEILGIGKLFKYILEFNVPSPDDSLKANALFTGNNEDEVIGIVFKINTNRKEDLDKAEGLGIGYTEKEIEIELIEKEEKLNAFTYVANNIDNSGSSKPYDWYLELIIKGAEEHQLPKEYVSKIQSTFSKEDPHPFRKNIKTNIFNESRYIRKYLLESYKLLFELNKSKEFEIKLPNHAFNNRKISIKKVQNRFTFQTDSIIPKGVQRHLELHVSEQKIQLKEADNESKFFIEGNHFLLKRIEYDFENGLKLLSGDIESMGNASIEDFNYNYLRLIIPLKKELRIINDYESYGFVIDYKTELGLIVISLNGKTFHLFSAKYEEKLYLIIDCIEKSILNEFQHCCQTILLTYAFLSGDYHSNEGYYLGFENEFQEYPSNILFRSFRESSYDLFAAFTTNVYIGINFENSKRDEKGFIDEETRKEMYQDIKFFSSSVFSNICQTASDNEKIFRALNLLISNQVSNLEMKIPIQYIVIEALTGVIIKSGNSELKLIDDINLANNLISDLKSYTLEFLERNDIQIKGNDLIVPFFKKIDNLNSPTNTDKLSKPFAEVGYTISHEEKKIIKLRDTFLHGSIKNIGTLDEDFKELFYISLKLHFLICVLFLKKSGFEGRIINYPKLYEYITEKYLDEEVLKKI